MGKEDEKYFSNQQLEDMESQLKRLKLMQRRTRESGTIGSKKEIDKGSLVGQLIGRVVWLKQNK